jgi:penicillin amidase
MTRCLLALFAISISAAPLKVVGLKAPVEILRDKWGVPHIYAKNVHDLFFAQGWMAAQDRLFQIDLWRRQGVGHLAEVLGPKYVARDRIARLVRFRGNWNEEWRAYAPDAQAIAMAFTRGINAYIDSLGGKRPPDFAAAGYDPAKWQPEDVTARIAGLAMLRNAASEVERALDIQKYGLDKVNEVLVTDPPVKIEVPRGLDLNAISADMVRDFRAAVGEIRLEDGSNNWVVDGTRSATGKPILASDPHRALAMPSLRKTVHLVAPGWNVIGAGEPALPGVALGHNEQIGFGFTIVGIDQQDLYIEKLNPSNPSQYRAGNRWVEMERETTTIAVKGAKPAVVELKYTRHGPVIWEDAARRIAVALRWVGAEPGGAGYLSALGIARAKNWSEFRQAVAQYKTPSENLLYADRAGNIGWIAGGLTPVRKNWTGLLPVPGETNDYEWSGWLSIDQMPQKHNPPEHWIATANANHLPPGYQYVLGYEFSPPFRFDRLRELLTGSRKFTVSEFAQMQSDVVSTPAQRFQGILRQWTPVGASAKKVRERFLRWDAAMSTDAIEPVIFEMWMEALKQGVFGPIGVRAGRPALLRALEAQANHPALEPALDAALAKLTAAFGPEGPKWKWGAVHQVEFRHPVDRPEFHVPPFARGGSADTVNAASWRAVRPFATNHGASFRQVLDFADWDRSVMTNVPGESGDPASKHYRDLVTGWRDGRHHPMPYSRAAVEAATEEKIELVP